MANLFRRITDLFQRNRRIARLIPRWMFNNERFPQKDRRQLIDEGYRKNLVIYRCVRELAESAAEPLILARHRGATNPLTQRHRLVRLLERPNPDQSAFSFIESIVTHQQTAGTWYVHIVRNGFGVPIELWPLRPDRTSVIPGPDGIDRYEYRLDGSMRGVPIPVEDVIEDRLIDPLDDYYGLSPIEVAAVAIDLDNDALRYLQRFFQNAATPLGIVKLTQRLKREQRQEIRDEWKSQFQGEVGWHDVAVLDQDADYKPIGSPLKDLSLEAVFTESEARACMAFGVPPIIIGVKLGLDRSTFANYAEARRSFWIETLKPIYRRIADRLTFSLAPEFGDDIEIDFDFAGVGALQEDKESIRKTALLGWDKGILTRNEAREVVGWPGVEGGNVFRANQQDMFIREGEEPRLLPPEPGNRIPAEVGGNGR